MNKQPDQENSNIGSKGDRGYNALPPSGKQGQVKSAAPQQGDNASKSSEKQRQQHQQQQQQQGEQQRSGKQKQSKIQEQQKS